MSLVFLTKECNIILFSLLRCKCFARVNKGIDVRCIHLLIDFKVSPFDLLNIIYVRNLSYQCFVKKVLDCVCGWQMIQQSSLVKRKTKLRRSEHGNLVYQWELFWKRVHFVVKFWSLMADLIILDTLINVYIHFWTFDTSNQLHVHAKSTSSMQ